MTILEISHKIERHFWDWAIPTLDTSPFLRRLFRMAFFLKQKFSIIKPYFLLACLSCAGFLNGILIYWLISR